LLLLHDRSKHRYEYSAFSAGGIENADQEFTDDASCVSRVIFRHNRKIARHVPAVHCSKAI